MLIQLPGGQWINPEVVSAVTADEDATVRVSAHPNRWIDIQGDNPEQAEALRDQIAEQVNRALYKPEGV